MFPGPEGRAERRGSSGKSNRMGPLRSRPFGSGTGLGQPTASRRWAPTPMVALSSAQLEAARLRLEARRGQKARAAAD